MRLMTKVAQATQDDRFHTFRDWHKGTAYRCHQILDCLNTRIPVGGNVLADVAGSEWEEVVVVVPVPKRLIVRRR